MKALISDNFQDKDLNQFDNFLRIYQAQNLIKMFIIFSIAIKNVRLKKLSNLERFFMETYLLKMIFQTDISKRHLTLISLKIFIENTVH